MSNQRCDAVNWLLWPLAGAATVSLILPQYEVTAFYAVTALTVLAHIHYGGCVVSILSSLLPLIVGLLFISLNLMMVLIDR